MSTNALIGTVNNTTGRFRAAYSHWSGDPTYLGPNLAALAAREGDMRAVVARLTDGPGWSIIDPATPSIEGAAPNPDAPNPDAPSNSPERLAWEREVINNDVVVIEGWGQRYQDDATLWDGTVPMPGTGIKGDPEDMTEWAYLLDEDEDVLHVFSRSDRRVVETIPLGSLGDVNWGAVECGADLERCGHCAYVHFEGVPEGSRFLTADKWLGRVPMGPLDAVAVVVRGNRYTVGKGGCRGEYLSTFRMSPMRRVSPSGRLWPTGWYSMGKDAGGRDVAVLTRTGTGEPVPGVEYEYPLTAEDVARADVGALAGQC